MDAFKNDMDQMKRDIAKLNKNVAKLKAKVVKLKQRNKPRLNDTARIRSVYEPCIGRRNTTPYAVPSWGTVIQVSIVTVYGPILMMVGFVFLRPIYG